MSKKKNNNYAFIDGQNLDKSIKEQGWNLDYRKFREFLANKFSVTKAFYFIGYTQDRNCILYKSLRNAGFHLSIRKPIRYMENNQIKIKANVDSNLITHTLIKINNYNKAVIVAGDSDYYCLCKFLIRQNKLCQVIVPCKAKCPKIYKHNLKFRNWLSYLTRQTSLLYK